MQPLLDYKAYHFENYALSSNQSVCARARVRARVCVTKHIFQNGMFCTSDNYVEYDEKINPSMAFLPSLKFHLYQTLLEYQFL